jgi:octaprenyl-diphosphate synthase
MKHSTPEEAEIIRNAIQKGDASNFQRILGIVQRTGALDHAQRQAQAETVLAQAAIAALPGSQYKDALLQLSAFAVTREF